MNLPEEGTDEPGSHLPKKGWMRRGWTCTQEGFSDSSLGRKGKVPCADKETEA